jgi:hypothetical protein
MSLFGIKVVSSPYAATRALRVERVPIKKRRRNWRLVWRTEPGVYMIGDDMLVMHPNLIARLPKGT